MSSSQPPRRPVTPALAPTVAAGQGDQIDGLATSIGAQQLCGTVLADKYEIQAFLGSGAMGAVYRARDRVLDRDVAVKFVRQDRAPSESIRARFLTEARAMARVRHGNVVAIYDYGEFHEVPYLVMEHLTGVPLNVWLLDRLPLAPDQALGIMAQICRGVQAIHEAGAIHRDIKPGNVLLGEGHRFVVSDLGLARFLATPPSGMSSGFIGTPSYMAPEAVVGNLPDLEFPSAADVYSLGVVAFELLTGVLPFPDGNPARILMHHMTTPAPRPSEVNPALAAGFDAPLLAALSKAVQHRPRTPMDLFDSLRDAHETRPSHPSGVRIVVADDDEGFRELAMLAIQHALPAAEVIGAANGEEALAEIERRHTDLVVLDLEMPVMNAIEVVAQLQGVASGARPRILVVTAVGGASDWRVLVSLGADSFLVKPLAPHQVSGAVLRLLSSG